MIKEIHYGLTLRLFDEEKFFGPGVAELLHRVDELSSIRKATQSMGMAYSKAWTILRRAESALGFPLLTTATGGKEGGGAALTPEGRQFLEKYDSFVESVNLQAQKAFGEIFTASAEE